LFPYLKSLLGIFHSVTYILLGHLSKVLYSGEKQL
jgi:hypothetical protein